MSGMISEWIGCLWDEWSSIHATSSAASVGAPSSTSETAATSSAKASATATETTSKASATTACKSASKPAACTKASTSATWRSIGEPVFTNLECTALPFVSVELSNSVACIVSVVEDDDTRALGTTIRSEVNVSANDVSNLSCESLE